MSGRSGRASRGASCTPASAQDSSYEQCNRLVCHFGPASVNCPLCMCRACPFCKESPPSLPSSMPPSASPSHWGPMCSAAVLLCNLTLSDGVAEYSDSINTTHTTRRDFSELREAHRQQKANSNDSLSMIHFGLIGGGLGLVVLGVIMIVLTRRVRQIRKVLRLVATGSMLAPLCVLCWASTSAALSALPQTSRRSWSCPHQKCSTTASCRTFGRQGRIRWQS